MLPERPVHVCGCTPTRPCSRAAVLFAKPMAAGALAAHLERSLDPKAAGAMPERDRLKHFTIPVATARTWGAETRPLRAFMKAAPRDWPELYAWADQQRIPEYRLHNQVAWLEGAGFARATMLGAAGGPERQRAIWRAT